MLSLINDILEIQFDKKNGAIRRLIDKVRNKVITENQGNGIFRLETDEELYVEDFQSFEYREDNDVLELRWKINSDVELIAIWKICLNAISVESRVENIGLQKLCSMEYPILDGINDLCSVYCENEKAGVSYIAHSYATGLLVENPIDNFNEEEGFRYMPYPESFSGATMQFFTYYCDGIAGLYFAAYDGEYYQKWLNFYKHQGKLRASQIYGYENIGSGNGLEAPWRFEIVLTHGDGWYEACDIYKEWALNQSWCSTGKRKDRCIGKRADWLFENMGACTFGINACYDRSLWLNRYSEDLKTPIFHILGPDWSRVEQNYYNSLPGGYNDWFPTRFHAENMKTIRKNGDRFAPFEFDFLVAIDKDESDSICNSLQKWPQKPKSKDEYKFTMLCPICDYTKKLHVNRDAQIIKESCCDSMYYDISANNIIKICMSDEHGHSVGAGREMTKAYREIYFKTKSRLSEEKGEYVPLGTEMMNEVFLDCLDYYQARANAQPCSFLETGIFRNIIRLGKAQVIPMFQYVYSGYAPLRIDGWGKLTKEGGDLIFHTIAKTYLWGGLFEINSEYSEMEAIGEQVNCSEDHYSRFKHVGFQYDKFIAEYLARFASLRTGKYNKVFAYGEMKRPPQIESSRVWRTYHQYNSSQHSMEQGDKGIILQDSVISARYLLGDKELIILANTADFTREITWKDNSLQNDVLYNVCINYISELSTYNKIKGNEIKSMKLLPLQLMVIENYIM